MLRFNRSHRVREFGGMFSTRDLNSFVNQATEAVQFKFVRNEHDLDNDSLGFKPVYTHQVFGEKESVFGYQGLQIKLLYTPDHLDTFIGVSYREAVTLEKHGLKPDNILQILSGFIPKGYFTNLDSFSVVLSQHKPFSPPGHLLHQYSSKNGLSFQVYKANWAHADFRAYYSRLQPMLLWFIENASLLDEDDEEEEIKWCFYLVYQCCTDGGGTCQYSVVGFASLYFFFCYPDGHRARISQMLIFPPYQRQGHGGHLLQTMYSDLYADSHVYDITVEDPSASFSSLRDTVDCCNALRLPDFQPPLIHNPFEGKIERAAIGKLKLHKAQARRVYEILRLKATDCKDFVQYRSYRLMVKKRLNGPAQRETKERERLKKFLEPAELTVAIASPLPREKHMDLLHRDYQHLEAEYRTVIEKVVVSTF